jgi:hypothetical protein
MMEGKQNREDEDIGQHEDLHSSIVHIIAGSSSPSPQSQIDTKINRARLTSNIIFSATLANTIVPFIHLHL